MYCRTEVEVEKDDFEIQDNRYYYAPGSTHFLYWRCPKCERRQNISMYVVDGVWLDYLIQKSGVLMPNEVRETWEKRSQEHSEKWRKFYEDQRLERENMSFFQKLKRIFAP